MKSKKVIVALDTNHLKNSIQIVRDLKKYAFAFKIGYEFFYNFGHDGYRKIKDEGVNIFLDLKLHDIPNTVEKAVDAISNLDPYFLTIHISGGDAMLKAANINKKKTKILGVSILTSLNSNLTQKYYFNEDLSDIVTKFCLYSIENNLDGIICSPKEIKKIKNIAGEKLLIITPGIRPNDYVNLKDDQARTMTPKEAIEAGADYLVIGRPITNSNNPVKTLIKINESIE